MPLPQPQQVVFPADHLTQDQHDGDGGQAHQEEQRVGSLHHIQALLMTHHLDRITDIGIKIWPSIWMEESDG